MGKITEGFGFALGESVRTISKVATYVCPHSGSTHAYRISLIVDVSALLVRAIALLSQCGQQIEMVIVIPNVGLREDSDVSCTNSIDALKQVLYL